MSSDRAHATKPDGAARKLDRAPRPGLTQGPSPADLSFDRWQALQRTAGNAAVSSLLAAAHPLTGRPTAGRVQREPAGTAAAPAASPTANSAMADQLAAMWEKSVVVPLARAADRLGREDKDLAGARAELAVALPTIRTIRDATPDDDPNRHRLTSVERIVKGVSDVIEQRLGGSTSDSQFEKEMMALRFEAVELGPQVKDKPPVEALVRGVIGLGAEVDFEVPAGAALKSPSELWKIFVIDYLWDAQREFGQHSAGWDWKSMLGVGLAIQEFTEAAAAGDPIGSRLFALGAGVTALLSRLKERIPAGEAHEATADDLADDAIRAYDLGAAMQKFLTGKPATTAESPGPTDVEAEPNFTWESKDPLEAPTPFVNDTDLLRPGE